MTDDWNHTIDHGFARQLRRRELGHDGCDDCGCRPAWVHGMIGTAAARVRLCSECAFYRRFYGDAPVVEAYDWY